MWYDFLEGLFILKLICRFFRWVFRTLWCLATVLVKLIREAIESSDSKPDEQESDEGG